MNIAVIMAGGFGTRLFPLSRTNYPKQFLRIFDNKSLLSLTYERVKNLDIFDEVWVCANKKHLFLIKRDIEDIGHKMILEEESKNTAFAILLSVFRINDFHKRENNFVFFPSDHFIFNDLEFNKTMQNLVNYLCKYEKTFVIGVKPSFPSTEYGYIKKGKSIDESLYVVERFIEKPNLGKAKYYYKSKNYLWNSGIYAFNSEFFISDFFQINHDLNKFAFLGDLLGKSKDFPNISIDYLYSQKSKNLVVLESSFGWSDLGSFEEIGKIANNNKEKVIELESAGYNVIVDEFEALSEKKYCLIDVKDLVVVDTKDFLLISKKGKSKKIANVLGSITQEKRDFNSFDFRPWGYYREIEKLDKYRIKHIVVYPKQELSLQYHNHRDEYWVVLRGNGRVFLDKEWIEISEGDFIRIPKGNLHKVINEADEYLEIIEVQIGNILSEQDIVRVEDKYMRD